MSKAVFITGTGTDVGKTFVTALILKKLTDSNIKAGYYKSALSGADSIEESDAGYVKKIANLNQDDSTLLSYLYSTPVSPHLASKLEGNPVLLQKVVSDYQKVKSSYDFVAVEGSGGIVCPIRYDCKSHIMVDHNQRIMLEDIVKALELNTVIVADAGLGTINAVVLTVEYLQNRNIGINGIILNNYTGGDMQEDNVYMIEQLTKIPVVAKVPPNAQSLDISVDDLIKMFE